MKSRHIADVEAVLARRRDNGGDYWASADGRLAVGAPFSTLTSLLILHELRVARTHEAVNGALRLILQAWRADGRFRLAPSGTLFLQVEYPFLRYNLFAYVYFLSFYERAKHDPRYVEALRALESKLDERGRIVVERPHRTLAGLSCCAKGRPSDLATARYREVLKKLAR